MTHLGRRLAAQLLVAGHIGALVIGAGDALVEALAGAASISGTSVAVIAVNWLGRADTTTALVLGARVLIVAHGLSLAT